jgi:hypothetical protein
MLNKWIISFFVLQAILPQAADFKPERKKAIFFKVPTIPSSKLNETLERVFKALEGLLVFYKREHKNLVLDGVFGLRVLEGMHNNTLNISNVATQYISGADCTQLS